MRTIKKSDTFPGKYGILVDGAIEYEFDLTFQEAQYLKRAHNAGAKNYDEAMTQPTFDDVPPEPEQPTMEQLKF